MTGNTPSSPMDAARWKAVSPLIDAAFADEVTDPLAYLAALPNLDTETRSAAIAFATRMLDTAASTGLPATRAGFDAAFLEATSAGPALAIGAHLGPWQVDRLIGKGGMGEVYLAHRADGLHDASVALKVIRDGIVGHAHYARFERERRALSKLVHPNIASLRDAGIADGVPYIALDYIEGEPITTAADTRKLSVRDRIGWVLQVGEAISHAHRALIVHRDLKPGNVLVDAKGQVTLLDFGIAKLLDDEATEGEATDLTQSFGRALSPDYAAPEQWTSGRVTTQTDVYSLGVVVYELLTGQKPFDSRTGARSDTTPVRPPSSAVTTSDAALLAAERRSTAPARWKRALAGDLDAIVMKALAYSREQRYSSMDAMLEELRRYLDGRPVKARGDWFAYRARKFVARNLWPLAGAATVFIALAGAAAGFYWQVQAVKKESAKTQAVLRLMLDMLAEADPDRSAGAEVTVRQALAHGVKSADNLASAEPDIAATVLGSIGTVYYNLNEFDRAADALRAAVAASASAHGRDSKQTVLAEIELAAALGKLRNEAHIPVARATFEAAEKRFGPLHESSLAAMASYVSLAARWPSDESHALSEELGKRMREYYGEKHWKYVQYQFDQAVTLTRADRWRDALALMESLDANIVDPTATDRREPIIRRYNIAAIRGRLGEFDKAIPALKSAISEFDQLLGTGNERTLEATGALASLYINSGQFALALPLFEERLVPYHAKRAAVSPEALLYTYAEWMAATLATGDVERTLAIAETAIPLAKTRFSKPIGSQAYSYRVAAMANALRGNLTNADGLLADAIATEKQISPKGWPYPQTLGVQAATAMQRGDASRAAELFAQAAKANAAIQGGTPAGTARYMVQQARVALARGDRAAAQSLAAEASPMLDKLPAAHPRRLWLAWLQKELAGQRAERPSTTLGYYVP